MTVDSSGNLTILADQSDTSSGNAVITFKADKRGTDKDILILDNEGSTFKTKLTVDSEVGTTGKWSVEGTGGEVNAERNQDSATATASYGFYKSRGNQSGKTVVQNGDSLGNINFWGYDGDQYINAAVIKSKVDAAPGDDDMPGCLLYTSDAADE